MSKMISRAIAPAFVSLVAVAGGLMPGSAASAAQLTYTAQSRTLSASAYTGTLQSASAPDYSTFDSSVTSTGTTAGNTASAAQRSQLLPTQITYSSQASGNRTSNSPADNISGHSVLDTTFTLDASSPYTFNLNTTSTPTTNAYCNATLTNLSNNTTTFALLVPTFPATAASGTLAAGSYRLLITHDDRTSTGGLSFSSGFAATLAVPEPASMGLLSAGLGLFGRRRRSA